MYAMCDSMLGGRYECLRILIGEPINVEKEMDEVERGARENRKEWLTEEGRLVQLLTSRD